jgi:hypothetical protein
MEIIAGKKYRVTINGKTTVFFMTEPQCQKMNF